MPCTVFAERMGFFHKGSGGKGIAPGDVCLTPPPPPAGPIPVPYVNLLSAADLSKGSKTVKIDGEPTALENASEISTSTGNEPATQGGGVVTHKTKGKGSFTLWCFTVKVEGKGVCRHGDPLLQNTGSYVPNCTAPGAITNLRSALAARGITDPPPCADDNKYTQECRPSITADQQRAVDGETCWECQKQINAGLKPLTRGGKWARDKADRVSLQDGKFANRDPSAMTVDHQPPLNRAWDEGGCWLGVEEFKKMMQEEQFAKPHCYRHYNQQSSKVKTWSKKVGQTRG